MTDLVDPSKIEQIVGAKRHALKHIGRAVTGEEKIYILHSQQCLDSVIDLRECEFSLALDNGVNQTNWATAVRLGCPVYLDVIGPLLVPTGRVEA